MPKSNAKGRRSRINSQSLGSALSHSQKTVTTRRDFLVRSAVGVSGLFAPPVLCGLSDFSGKPALPELHLHPHYRSPLPLDAILARIPPGSDQFITEKYAAEIAAVLETWSSDLRRSPESISAIGNVLAKDFSGVSLASIQSRLVRSGPINVWKNSFPETTVSNETFLRDLKAYLSPFSQIFTAEFQITGIEANLPRIVMRIRYDLVASGANFHREQRTGYWELEWQEDDSHYFLKHWKALDETCSRTTAPAFADIASIALGRNPSYKDQLLHGSDYWRTVLDGACGIDVYAHNGVCVGDIDNDGFDDLYICQPAGLPNRLYRNLGDGTFEDITDSSGVGVLDNTSCALFVDIDNDGRQDLVVVRTDGPVLFLNQGNGKFRQKVDAFKFATPPRGTFTGAAAADYDRDGWLDLYFCLYNFYQGTGQYRYPLPYFDANNGPPNFLLRNNRDATFTDVTAEAGLDQNNTRYSFCCGWNDYNRDGWPDLYVVNDFGRKNLYRNNGNGTFTDVAAETGVEDVGAGMSVCWFDYNNDGVEDLYVANMWTAAGERISTQENFQPSAPPGTRALYQKHAMGNSLLRNNGNRFADVTGSASVGMGRWAWSSDAWDFDHDGFLDLYIANGMVSGPLQDDLNGFFWRQTVSNSPNDANPSKPYEEGWNAINSVIREDGTWSGYERNVFYVNNRDGTFSDISGAVSLDFLEDARSFALADFDRDGRQEVFLKNRNAPQLRLLKNVMAELPPSISLRLQGTKSNRDAIGTVITLSRGELHQTRSLQAGSGFLAQHSKELFFGLGNAEGPIHASIRWSSGLIQDFDNLPANHVVWIEEGSGSIRTKPFKATASFSSIAMGQREYTPEPLPETIETWLLSPIAAPDCSLPDLAGKLQNLSAFRGKSVLLNFWSVQSPACRNFLQDLGKSYSRWQRQGFQLLAINTDDEAHKEDVQRLVLQSRSSFPVLFASDDVAATYNILYRYCFDRHRDLPLPASFLLDSNGDIVKIYTGAVKPEHIDRDFRDMPRTTAERISAALPFTGVSDVTEYTRNHLSYGSIFFQHGYLDQAARSFEAALHDNPQSAEAAYGLGSVYLQQGKIAEAKEQFEHATKLQPTSPSTLPDAWNNLGLLAAREGRSDEAIAYFQQALALSPDHLVALENLGNVYRQQKNWGEARKLLDRAVSVGPNDAEANYSLGMVYAQLNDVDRAQNYLERALKLRPGYPEALNNLGILSLRRNHPEQAVANFEECIRVAPAFDQAYLNLARVYVIQGTPDKARTVLLDLLKQHPDHALAKSMLGQLETTP